MKFVCLGYMDEAKWNKMSACEQSTLMDDCLAYDAELRARGRMIGSEAMQSGKRAVTLRSQNGQITVSDGSFAGATEQLGWVLLIEARDLNHAIQLMSKHPGVRAGAFEIRPAN